MGTYANRACANHLGTGLHESRLGHRGCREATRFQPDNPHTV